jgi:hypothetical protein
MANCVPWHVDRNFRLASTWHKKVPPAATPDTIRIQATSQLRPALFSVQYPNAKGELAWIPPCNVNFVLSRQCTCKTRSAHTDNVRRQLWHVP